MQLGLTGTVANLKSDEPTSIPKTIIFTQTKNAACKVYSFLRSLAFKREYVDMYHASLTKCTKSSVQERFSGNTSLRCLVATVAFGMVCILAKK